MNSFNHHIRKIESSYKPNAALGVNLSYTHHSVTAQNVISTTTGFLKVAIGNLISQTQTSPIMPKTQRLVTAMTFGNASASHARCYPFNLTKD